MDLSAPQPAPDPTVAADDPLVAAMIQAQAQADKVRADRLAMYAAFRGGPDAWNGYLEAKRTALEAELAALETAEGGGVDGPGP